MAKLRRFSIYHPIEGKINNNCAHNYSYEYVTTVEALNLVKSLHLSQNKFNPAYKALSKRDTTIGDLITVEDKLYMLNINGGFKRIPVDKALYKSVMKLDEAIIEILSRRTLTDDDVDNLIENCY